MQDPNGIMAFYFEPSDDGKSAIVEYVAQNRTAFQPLFNDKSITLFEKGRITKASIDAALKGFRHDFDLDKFGMVMPSGVATGAPTYQYYVTDAFSTLDPSKWNVTGNLIPTHAGLTAPDPNGGAAMSKALIPDSSSESEVRASVALTSSGGYYTIYLQASPDARTGGTGSGSYVAVEMQNPTISGTSCTANFVVLQSRAAIVSLLSSFPHSCRNGMALRMAAHAGALLVWTDQDAPLEFLLNLPIAGAGQPGVGARATPAGNAITQVQLGAISRTAPPAIDPAKLRAAAFPNHVDVQWQGVSLASLSPGLAAYWIYRDGLYFQRTSKTSFQDETVTQQSSHTYSIYTVDQHFNFSQPSAITVAVPTFPATISGKFPPPTSTTKPPKPSVVAPQIELPAPRTGPSGGFDPRRVGVQATGAYWGGAGEQIDLASGNLNFSLPFLELKARGGWSVPLRLSYNSQTWRMDSGGEWLLGEDVGYGFGWKLLAGAITPIWANSVIDHYLYTDATGAEYRLDQNNNNLWSSVQGIYVSFDANTNILHFNDGTYWVLGCQSAGGEQDAGTLYPTIMEDTNGNQIWIQYAPGAGSSLSMNSSARITYILDARSASGYAAGYWSYPQTYGWVLQANSSFVFYYNSDPTPHLIKESGYGSFFDFSYTQNQPLNSPFSGASYGSVALLSSAAIHAYNIRYAFQYGTNSGEMTQMTAPLGGTLQWQYRTFTYGTGISQREVYYRFMPQYSGVYWWFAHNDSYDVTQPYHQYTQYGDSATNASKVDWFQAIGALIVPWAYTERTPANTADYMAHIWNWTQNAAGNVYVGTDTTYLNAASSPTGYCCSGFLSSATTQSVDIYGNVVQQQVYDYGAGSPPRTYNLTYLSDPNYTSRYIRNRVTAASVTSSAGTITLATNYYDGSDFHYCGGGGLQNGGGTLHDDPAYGASFTYRGNVTYRVAYSGTNCYAYQTTGVVYHQENGVGTVITNSPSAATNYSLPGIITPNGQGNLSTSFGYDANWGLASVTGANGATATTTYDGTVLNLPLTATSVDGAVTNYTYSFSPGANLQTATISTTNNGTTTTQWKRTTLDGFGRVISVQTGHDSAPAVSEVDTQYAPCACSPLGKMTAVSMPYGQGQTPVWTTYTYDGSGRTVSIRKNEGSTTSYSYAGNVRTETDPAGKWKSFTTDAFGNLTVVGEPDPANQPSGVLYTYYTYNGLNQLTDVSMPRNGQDHPRHFTWSGVDLSSATNPENGTVTYQYDAAHHVTLRTDAKSQQTQYRYDAYGRLTQTRHYQMLPAPYPNPPVLTQVDQVDYYYDTPISSFGSSYTWGRLAGVAWGQPNYTSPEMWYEYNYNQAGRVTGQRMAFIAANQEVDADATYAWDNQGRMTSMASPDGDQFQYQYDSMSNLSTMLQYRSDNGQWPIIASAAYNWAGLQTSLWYANFNESRTYNSLLQLTRLQNTGMDIQYIYQAGQNNGRIVQSIDNVLGETVNYTYDTLNRVSMAEEVHGIWGNAFSYDGWGTINGQTFTPGQAATPGTASLPQPRDANGNYLGPSAAYNSYLAFSYDVENRLLSQPGGSAPLPAGANNLYDPWGKRVRQCCNPNDGSNTYTFYGIDGKRLYTFGEIDNGDGTYTTWPINRYFYFGGKLIQVNNTAVATDRVGSVRYNSNGERFSYYPYGRERTSTSDQREKFGTYFRDWTLGMTQDYADQRYYDAWSGTFWSADPTGLAAVNSKNPLSWNRYTYGLNDPINGNDPTGRVDCQAYNEYLRDVGGIDDLGLCGDNGDGSTSGGGGGGAGCYGTYLAPNPDPSCYAPVPPPAPPVSSAPPPPDCSVELEYRPAGITGVLGRTHASLVIEDSFGYTFTMQGEPQNYPLPPWGNLVVSNTQGNIGDTQWGNTLTSAKDPQLCDQVSQIEKAELYYSNNPVLYDPLGPNSNTLVHWLLESGYIDQNFTAPPGSTGWNLSLYGHLF
jgi:RHS repeat-associated protein